MKILVIGDMHVGSIYGLAPLESIPEDRTNAWSKWVYESWEDLCKKHRNPDYLLLIGDLADGPQVRILGTDALFTDIDRQVEIASKLLDMVKGDAQIFGVNGSGYHGGEGLATNIDRRVIEKIGGKCEGNKFTLDLPLERIQMSHGAGSSTVGLDSYLKREMMFSKIDAQKRKIVSPTIILRGHQHRMFTVQDDARQWGILNGCWQYTTPFMAKKSVNISPSIGATMIEIEDATKIYRLEYPIPENVREEIDGFESLTLERTEEERQKNLEVLKTTLKDKKF